MAGPVAHESFPYAGMTHDVYSIGCGPAVILMHELPGLSPAVFDLGQTIADEGYRVVMPCFYGAVGQESSVRGLVQICVSREFTLLRKGRSSKITRWLRGLASHCNDGRGVAAIGMCATGGLVLGLLLEDSVVVGVASQPSLPFAWRGCGTARKADLGVSDDDLDQFKASPKPLMAVRFYRDPVCPKERVDAMGDLDRAEALHVPSDGDYEAACPPIKKKAHSVLTYHHVGLRDHPSNDAFRQVVTFLTSHLQPEQGGQG